MNDAGALTTIIIISLAIVGAVAMCTCEDASDVCRKSTCPEGMTPTMLASGRHSRECVCVVRPTP